MAGVEADHARLRAAAKKGSGDRVLINVPALRALLASRSLNAIADRTKAVGRAVDRRQLHRLRDGELRKIRRGVVESIATALSVPVDGLIVEEEKDNPNRRLQPAPFSSVSRARGMEVANRWWRAAGNQDAAATDLSELFGTLLSYDRWHGALYQEGTVALAPKGPPPVRARKNLEERRSQFAHHLAEALALLADEHRPQRGRMDWEHAAAFVAQFQGLCALTERLRDEFEDPAIRGAVAQALRKVQDESARKRAGAAAAHLATLTQAPTAPTKVKRRKIPHTGKSAP